MWLGRGVGVVIRHSLPSPIPSPNPIPSPIPIPSLLSPIPIPSPIPSLLGRPGNTGLDEVLVYLGC